MERWQRGRARGTDAAARRARMVFDLACAVGLVAGCTEVWAIGDSEMSETYPDGDPLGELDGVARLYLHDSDFAIPGTTAGLALISPFDGIGDA